MGMFNVGLKRDHLTTFPYSLFKYYARVISLDKHIKIKNKIKSRRNSSTLFQHEKIKCIYKSYYRMVLETGNLSDQGRHIGQNTR